MKNPENGFENMYIYICFPYLSNLVLHGLPFFFNTNHVRHLCDGSCEIERKHMGMSGNGVYHQL